MKLLDISTRKFPNTFTMVDDEDFEVLNKWKWSAVSRKSQVRATRTTGKPKRNILIHRAIMNAPNGVLVDHINGDPLDNRRDNLRLCTVFQNNCNKHARLGALGLLGVSKRDNRFYAQISIVHKKRKHIGSFATPIEAAKAYNEAAKTHYGEFANLNVIPGETV